MPTAISVTPGLVAAAPTVTSALPPVGPPISRYQAAPWRAISAAWARLSTFWTSVARPSIPRSNGRGGVVVGRASASLTKWTAADSSPATYVGGAATSATGRRRSAARSAIARDRAARAMVCSLPTYRTIRSAPTASAAICAPSSTRCGRAAIRVRSLALRGSPSAPLASTIARPSPRAATVAHFRATGKPAPPRPRRPLSARTSMMARRSPAGGNGPNRRR